MSAVVTTPTFFPRLVDASRTLSSLQTNQKRVVHCRLCGVADSEPRKGWHFPPSFAFFPLFFLSYVDSLVKFAIFKMLSEKKKKLIIAAKNNGLSEIGSLSEKLANVSRLASSG